MPLSWTEKSVAFILVSENRPGKTEVCYLDIPLLVQQDVSWFEIEVNDVLVVGVVDGLDHLAEELTTDIFWQFFTRRPVVQFTVPCLLH